MEVVEGEVKAVEGAVVEVEVVEGEVKAVEGAVAAAVAVVLGRPRSERRRASLRRRAVRSQPACTRRRRGRASRLSLRAKSRRSPP